MLRIFIIFAGAVFFCFADKENNLRKGRGRGYPVFPHAPQDIHYYVTRDHSVNLTWVADHVCKIQIKCAGKKFQEGGTRVCGKSCQGCRKRKKTKIVTLADFPKDTRTITCQCKVWGVRAARTEKIIIEKAYLRPNFGKVPSCRVVSLNSTVVLPCAPPIGSPPAKVTWYKIGESSSIFRNKGRRRVRKGQLVIEGGQVGDSGEYRCVAQNIARRREGPVIKLVVGENVSGALCNKDEPPCINQSSPDCETKRNETFKFEPTLLVGSQDAFFTVDLFNISSRRPIKAENVFSFDFSWEPGQIFWSDRKSIKKLSLHDGISKDTPFLFDDGGSVEGLFVHWVAKKLYWTDGQHNAIYVGDPKSGVKVKVIDNGPDSPTLKSVVVSHSESYIYWTSWAATPIIERARLDGSDREVFTNNSVYLPNALAINEADKKLYLAGTDANNYGIIEAVSLDGLNRTVIFNRTGFIPTALDFYQDFLYCSDSKKNAVLRLSHQGGEGTVLINGLRNPIGVKIFHNRKESSDPCLKDNGRCDQLCLYLPFRGRHRCLCEENFFLSENGKHCSERPQDPSDGVTESTPTPTSVAHSFQTGILSSVILLLVVVGIVYCVVRVIKKGCPCQRPQDLPRIPRQSTNSDDRTEQGEDLLEITDQTDLENAGSQPPKESSNLIGRDYSREPSGSVAACEDSSQTSPKSLVVYFEQHGGVAILGDDAQLHHHSSPQS